MITYKQGNLLDSDCKVICHQVNCQGVMGSGIAKEIRYRFPSAYQELRKSFLAGNNKLGNIDLVYDYDETSEQIGNWVFICNMYAQENYLPRGVQHTDYEAFRACIHKLKDELSKRNKNGESIKIGFPYKIGCGLGGGDWVIVRSIIEQEFEGDQWQVEIWKLN
jgi:O-acetyl-ADP-ribose deacetylase (regulator of RNase III)